MNFLKSSINLPTVTTGSSLMNMSGGATMKMSPMESMKEVFLEIRDNTAKTVELLKVAVLGTPSQQRDKGIGEGETDKEEKGPGILSKVGTTLGIVSQGNVTTKKNESGEELIGNIFEDGDDLSTNNKIRQYKTF